MKTDSQVKTKSSTGEWKAASDGGKYRTGYDGRDGSYKVEKISAGKNHTHDINKASTEGGIKHISLPKKSNR